MTTHPRTTVVALGAVAALGLAACSPSPTTSTTTTTAGDSATATSGTDSPSTLRILAGSEVKDMAPVLAEAERATGVHVEMSYAGTIDGAEQVASGDAGKEYDATWFASNRYLGLLPDGNKAISTSAKIMASPVILGVRPAKAHELGWDRVPPTWAQISQAVMAKKFTYGMTNPASSNSGFSALVGVATALAGGGSAIDPARVSAVKPRLTQFFSGQKLTSGSSGWLAERFVEQATGRAGAPVDGLINYESVLVGLDSGGTLPEKLTLVYPKDGVVSGDYPLSLLSSATGKQQAYQKLTDWLRTPAAQQRITAATHRRPVVPGVRPAPELGQRLLVELPFPAQRAAADGLISTYLDEVRRPSQTIYVLDVSGSMSGDRLDQLKQAFAILSGKEGAAGDRFTTFHRRERVTLIPFSSDAQEPTTRDVGEQDPAQQLVAINDDVQGLHAGGETALYSALVEAYKVAATQVRERPDTFTSVVVMTDGEKTAGIDASEFLADYDALPAPVKAVPTFSVLFGDSDPTELTQIADRTHGKVFDARSTSLPAVFKEIRGYQ